VRSSHLPFKMHYASYVRSSLPVLMYVGSIATPLSFYLISEMGLKDSRESFCIAFRISIVGPKILIES